MQAARNRSAWLFPHLVFPGFRQRSSLPLSGKSVLALLASGRYNWEGRRLPAAFQQFSNREESVLDYDLLLNGCCEMGCRLLGCGAEIHRVEDTVHRLCAAYQVKSEVFAIPNCLIVSVTDGQGHIHTRMRRAEIRGIDIEALEGYNALSRRLCAAPPEDPGQIAAQVRQVAAGLKGYAPWMHLMGYFIGGGAFALFFSGGWLEAIAAAIAGLLSGLCLILLNRSQSNFFISTLASGFVLAFSAYALLAFGMPVNIQVVITGAIMVLVPGLVFTNFMSDLLTGDIVAGLSTFVRAVLTAGAIALGTGAALALCLNLWTLPGSSAAIHSYPPALYCLFAFVGCLGFCFPYNVQGLGGFLCCLGGALGWAVYLAAQAITGNPVYLPSLFAAIAVAIYAEIMARLRKCPATSYLVISYFPLVPGFTIYQAMEYGIQGNTQLFLETFIRTFGIAGCIALGTLAVSTAVRILQHRHKKGC